MCETVARNSKLQSENLMPFSDFWMCGIFLETCRHCDRRVAGGRVDAGARHVGSAPTRLRVRPALEGSRARFSRVQPGGRAGGGSLVRIFVERGASVANSHKYLPKRTDARSSEARVVERLPRRRSVSLARVS